MFLNPLDFDTDALTGREITVQQGSTKIKFLRKDYNAHGFLIYRSEISLTFNIVSYSFLKTLETMGK